MKCFGFYVIFLAVTIFPSFRGFSLPEINFEVILRFVRNKLEDILDKAGGNTQCADDLKSLVHDSVFGEKWALMMLDASGKMSSGFFSGNYHVVGNYDECIGIKEVKGNREIDGQYCTVVLLPSDHFSSEYTFLLDSVALTNYVGIHMSNHTADIVRLFKMTYGVCIPKSCSIDNLQKLWDYVEFTFGIPVHFYFSNVLCTYRDKPVDPYPIDIYIYGLFGIYVIILLASTFYDLVIYQNLEEENKPSNSLWIAFSLYTNTQKLFSYSKSSVEGHLDCISGIKVLSIFWVIFGHRVLFNVFSGTTNAFYAFEWKNNIENTFIIGAFLAVDTFFLLSGLLLSYGYLNYKSTSSERGIPLTAFYALRFLRLSPALLATVLFYISGFKLLSDGPAWPGVARKFSISCRYTWWATLLFFTNFIHLQYQCVEQSWYLAVDSQLYMISPIILMSLEKNPLKTCLACLGTCFVSGVYAFIITIKNEYTVFFFEGNTEYQQNIYTPTFVRMPPWLIGIVLGYLIFKYKKIRIHQTINLALWITSSSLMTYIIMVHAVLTRNDYDAFNAALYNSCVRSSWAIALGLLIFSCVTGHGGVVNEFLSLPIFQVLVRLSYSMYLVHIVVLAYFIGSRRNLEHFSNIKGVHDFMGDMFFVFVVSIVWTLAFESPFMAISKRMISSSIPKGSGNEIVRSKRKNKNNEYFICSCDTSKELKKIK